MFWKVAGVLIYLAILIVIGVVASRRMKDVRDYYAAGKKLNFWAVAFSARATGESGWLLLGLTMGVAVLCIRAFQLLSKQAAYLMMPCLVWIFLTWALNFWLWTTNGGILYRIFIS